MINGASSICERVQKILHILRYPNIHSVCTTRGSSEVKGKHFPCYNKFGCLSFPSQQGGWSISWYGLHLHNFPLQTLQAVITWRCLLTTANGIQEMWEKTCTVTLALLCDLTYMGSPKLGHCFLGGFVCVCTGTDWQCPCEKDQHCAPKSLWPYMLLQKVTDQTRKMDIV